MGTLIFITALTAVAFWLIGYFVGNYSAHKDINNGIHKFGARRLLLDWVLYDSSHSGSDEATIRSVLNDIEIGDDCIPTAKDAQSLPTIKCFRCGDDYAMFWGTTGDVLCKNCMREEWW